MIPDTQKENTYIILDAADLSSVDFSLIGEKSSDTLRYNLDGTKFVVKYNDDVTPAFLAGKTSYTHAEITAYFADPLNGWIEKE